MTPHTKLSIRNVVNTRGKLLRFTNTFNSTFVVTNQRPRTWYTWPVLVNFPFLSVVLNVGANGVVANPVVFCVHCLDATV